MNEDNRLANFIQNFNENVDDVCLQTPQCHLSGDFSITLLFDDGRLQLDLFEEAHSVKTKNSTSGLLS